MRIESKPLYVPPRKEVKINPVHTIKKELPRQRFLLVYNGNEDVGELIDILV